MIWVIGRGLLGSEVIRELRARNTEILVTGREVDITDPKALDEFARGKRFDWVVNCAAYTAVDKAEDEPSACRRLNADGPAHLARWASSHGAALLHVSTDYVFSGDSTTAYQEDDAVSPASVYGATKAEGEAAVRELCRRHLIVRTSWLYGATGPNFVYSMLRLMRDRDEVGVVNDQRGTPTWTGDLSRAIAAMVANAEGRWGTYHASAEGTCTWYEFASAIREETMRRSLLTLRAQLRPLTSAEYPTKARRPAWSVLDKTKLREQFGFVFPQWRESLTAFLDSPLETRLFT